VNAGNGVGGLEIVEELHRGGRKISRFLCQVSGGGSPRLLPSSATISLRGRVHRGSILPMRSLTTAPMDPKELRPLLHAEVDRLRDENLLVLHRVALELELDEVTERLNEDFDADRAAGKLARLPEIIREARAALRTRLKIRLGVPV